jgi:hypothetical protein
VTVDAPWPPVLRCVPVPIIGHATVYRRYSASRAWQWLKFVSIKGTNSDGGGTPNGLAGPPPHDSGTYCMTVSDAEPGAYGYSGTGAGL